MILVKLEGKNQWKCASVVYVLEMTFSSTNKSAMTILCAKSYFNPLFFSLTVVLGTTQYKNPGQSFFTRNFLCHPQYSSRTIDYDYAIVTISGASLNSAVS